LETGARTAQATITIAAIENVLASLTAAGLRKVGLFVPPTPPATAVEAWVAYRREPMFVKGRYFKLARAVAQTKWLIAGQEGLFPSVEEAVAEHVGPLFEGEESRLHAAGREDVDVRMLGEGRPFILEVRQPRLSKVTQEQLTEAEARINASFADVCVSGLTKADASDMAAITGGAQSKRKEYAALVHTTAPITEAGIAALETPRDLEVLQTTPSKFCCYAHHYRPSYACFGNSLPEPSCFVLVFTSRSSRVASANYAGSSKNCTPNEGCAHQQPLVPVAPCDLRWNVRQGVCARRPWTDSAQRWGFDRQ
jgi:hypothetical protein